MLLSTPEIHQVMQQVRMAFPVLTDWQYKNVKDGEYFGFSVWGQYVPRPHEDMPKHFFITFDTYEDRWYGHLTIGQPWYLWSSADVGDAHLVDTDACLTLSQAMIALQEEIKRLLRALGAL